MDERDVMDTWDQFIYDLNRYDPCNDNGECNLTHVLFEWMLMYNLRVEIPRRFWDEIVRRKRPSKGEDASYSVSMLTICAQPAIHVPLETILRLLAQNESFPVRRTVHNVACGDVNYGDVNYGGKITDVAALPSHKTWFTAGDTLGAYSGQYVFDFTENRRGLNLTLCRIYDKDDDSNVRRST